MPSPLSSCIRNFTPPSSVLNSLLKQTTSTMSIDASTLSTVSSLTSNSTPPSGRTSPSSTLSNAGWGSQDIPSVPTPPTNHMECSTTINPRPIISVDVPIYAHHLREGTLGEPERDALHSLLYSPHIHRILESHLDDNSPLWSATRIYIQVQRLRTLLDLASSPSSIGRRCNTLHTIQRTIQEDLFSLFHQFHMPEFVADVERYSAELTVATNPQVIPSASASPLTAAIELAIQNTELNHEVLTEGTIQGTPVDGLLHRNHPRYAETCFECHHLGHIRINCQWYVCPICKVNRPGHPQYCCPLNHRTSRPSSSSSSSSSTRPRPIPPPRSHHMRRGSSHPPRCIHCPSPPRSPSPIEDFDYDDVAISNMTGSPVGSYAYF